MSKASINSSKTDNEVEMERDQGDEGLSEAEKLPGNELEMVERDRELEEKQKLRCSICPEQSFISQKP